MAAAFHARPRGREFIWDFLTEARRIREITPGVPISAEQFEELIAACGRLDALPQADEVIRLTLESTGSRQQRADESSPQRL